MLIISREVGYQYGEAFALGGLGRMYAVLGDEQRAIAHFEQAITVGQSKYDLEGVISRCSWHLGLLYEKQGDLRRAVPLIQTHVDFLWRIGVDTEAMKCDAHFAAIREKLRYE